MTKTIKKGFTIIELLIVIVVIGILAAIVVVTYQGVQNKANKTAAEQNAREVANKATAFNASAARFPKTLDELTKATSNIGDASAKTYPEAKLSEKVSALVKTTGPTASDKTALLYQVCKKGTGVNEDFVGAQVIFWNHETNKAAEGNEIIKAGETSGTGVTCDAAPQN